MLVNNSLPKNSASKDHYRILDALRGVAALMVVLFHICEANSPGHPLTQWINHGYLAVDFFFMLSGFVIAYAYDDRWPALGVGGFFKRRLIRLHPMIIMGMTVGAALFYLQSGPDFPSIHTTPVWTVLLVMLVGYTLLPVPAAWDIRGWGEMHPLDGPAWSLFYEYLANIAYALVLRRLSLRILGLLTALAGAFLIQLAVFGHQGDLIGGWSLDAHEVHIGFARLLFPFIAGMLLARLRTQIRIKHPFAVCSLLLITVFSLPRFGGDAHRWMNGAYESFCVIAVFPLVVSLGAGTKSLEGPSAWFARFVGDLSYPLYITHYPLIYIYTEWVATTERSIVERVENGAIVLVSAILIATLSLKLYDEPIRKRLTAYMSGSSNIV